MFERSRRHNVDLRIKGFGAKKETELSEIEFLVSLRSKSGDELSSLLQERIRHLQENDEALKAKSAACYQLASQRFAVIVLTLVLEMLNGVIIYLFSAVLDRNILLASFMPVISAVSGNVGLQASACTGRGIYLKQLHGSDFLPTLLKELGSAFLLGLPFGTALLGLGWLWGGSFSFGLVVGLALLTSMLSGALLGTVGPYSISAIVAAFKGKYDPASTTGPFETAAQDMVGFTLLLVIATLVLPENTM